MNVTKHNYVPILKQALLGGIRKGLRSAFLLLALMIPISFALLLMKWSGVLHILSIWVNPAFAYFGLPGSCSLAFLSGVFLNCYSAVAVIMTLELTARQITIISLMVLFAHSLPVEVAIQQKAGTSAAIIAAYRFGASIISGIALNVLLPASDTGTIVASTTSFSAPVRESFMPVLWEWTLSTIRMTVQIMCIVVAIMTIHELLKRTNILRILTNLFYPVCRIMGLSKDLAFLWFVSNTIGLAFGAGVILSEIKEMRISKREIHAINLSVATSHSLIEDTLLFLIVGASLPWITIPRLIVASVAVWAYRLYSRLKRS